MGDVKAKFHFVAEAQDPRTTVVKVKTIQLIDQLELFQFPPEAQTKNEHQKLFEHTVAKGVVKSLKTRNKYCKVLITLAEGELGDMYLDEEGNIVFNEFYLEAACAYSTPPS